MFSAQLRADVSAAEAGARRELRVFQAALRTGAPVEALQTAFEEHQRWLQGLLGCSADAVRPYLAWRLAMTKRVGPMREDLHLADAEANLLYIIRKGEAHA